MEVFPMINSTDILTRLQNGEKAEDIANELVNALNAANDAYLKEQEAKKFEAEAKAKREAKKMQDMQDILDLMHDFCIDYYCDTNEDINAVEAAFADLTAEKVITMVEEAGAAALEFEAQLKSFNDMLAKTPLFKPEDPNVIRVKKADADAIIKSFLNTMGL